MKRQFGSDIYSAICPEAFDALARANAEGHARAYGHDAWTLRALDLLDQAFACNRHAFFVLSGTLANSLALAAALRPYHAVLCHHDAHIFTTECGGPEFFAAGARLIPLPGDDGKIDPAALATHPRPHRPRPRLQAPRPQPHPGHRRGTLYSLPELKALIDLAHAHSLLVHMDGARFANAVAALDVTPRQLSRDIGLDVLSLGGSKTGGTPAEVIVFFNDALADEFAHRHKQAGQLASKMRYLSAPWVGLLENGAWLAHARHANDLAALLEQRLAALDVHLAHPRHANLLFARLSPKVIAALDRAGWEYILPISPGVYRLVTSWDNTESDVDDFATALRDALRALSGSPGMRRARRRAGYEQRPRDSPDFSRRTRSIKRAGDVGRCE